MPNPIFIFFFCSLRVLVVNSSYLSRCFAKNWSQRQILWFKYIEVLWVSVRFLNSLLFKPCVKGQLISKAKWQAKDSSKKRTTEVGLNWVRCVFVRLLEEALDRKKRLEIILPLVRPSKTHHSIWKYFFIVGAVEYLERLEGKLRTCLFFYSKIF